VVLLRTTAGHVIAMADVVDHTQKAMIVIRVARPIAEAMERAAIGRGTSAPRLVKKLVEAAVIDDLIGAILDDGGKQ